MRGAARLALSEQKLSAAEVTGWTEASAGGRLNLVIWYLTWHCNSEKLKVNATIVQELQGSSNNVSLCAYGSSGGLASHLR